MADPLTPPPTRDSGGGATDPVWIGADPGGRNKFGVALLNSNGAFRTWCVSCADEAVEIVARQTATQPAGVGIDAPLWWSSGPSSDRRADQWLRTTHKLSGGQVQTANSLRGAALVQGAMFLHRVRRRFPQIRATEAHPKALLVALGNPTWPAFCRRFGLVAATALGDAREDERDAVIAAVAAREGFENRWTRDLSRDRHASELDPSHYWLAPVRYFWPEG